MPYKSIRTNSGLGGRPRGKGVKHNIADEIIKEEGATEEIPDVTDDIREAIRSVLIKNTGNIEGWLKQIGEQDPIKALTLYKELSEFIIPKIQRSDSKIDPSSPVKVVFESTSAYKNRMEEKKQLKITRDDYN